MKNKYPFTPKSTSYLERGQFWAVPLSNGKFCCGAVLHLLSRGNKTKTKVFHAGLLNWVGDKPPTENNVVGKEILHSGAVHIKAITENGVTVIEKQGRVTVSAINPMYLSRLFNNAELDEYCEKMHDLYTAIIEDATL